MINENKCTEFLANLVKYYEEEDIENFNTIKFFVGKLEDYLTYSGEGITPEDGHQILWAIILSKYGEDLASSLDNLKEFGYDPHYIHQVYLMVLSIWRASDTPNTKTQKFMVLSDINNSILGVSKKSYFKYCDLLKSESIDEEQFVIDRIKFLEILIDSEYIFYTSYFRSKYEGFARRNIKTEKEKLTKELLSRYEL